MFENIEEYFENLLSLPTSPKKSDWEKVFNSMAVHTRKRVPKELLLARRPNEDAKIHQYRIDNYRPITYGSMNKALDDLYRIVSGISYTINADQSVKDYLNNHMIGQYSNSIHKEIINAKVFIEKITLKRDIEDPNGFLIWFPSGDGLTDSSKKVVPEPKLILSSQFVYADEIVFIYLSTEKTPLKNDKGEIVLKGDLYYFFTKTELWKMFQVGSESDPTWEQEKIYTHNLNAFPVIVLGGDMNSEGYYDSYFSPYLAFGDEAIHQFSDWQAIMTTSSFPIKEMFGTECRVRKIDKSSNKPSDQEEGFSGAEFELELMQPDPYGIIKRRIPITNLNDDSLPPEIPSIRYINPDITVAKYSGESWEKLIEFAEQALNIDMTVGVNQSGKAKQIDKESQYSMITKIGNNFFDNIYTISLRIIDGLLNRKMVKDSQASINKPSTFWVKNESDLVDEINSLKTSNAPTFFISESTLDLAKKRFGGNPVNEKIFRFISLYDPFYTYTTSEKTSLVASGMMKEEDGIRSTRMFSLLNQIVEEKAPDQFIKMDFKQINEEFEAMLDQYLPKAPNVQFDENGNVIQ